MKLKEILKEEVICQINHHAGNKDEACTSAGKDKDGNDIQKGDSGLAKDVQDAKDEDNGIGQSGQRKDKAHNSIKCSNFTAIPFGLQKSMIRRQLWISGFLLPVSHI